MCHLLAKLVGLLSKFFKSKIVSSLIFFFVTIKFSLETEFCDRQNLTKFLIYCVY